MFELRPVETDFIRSAPLRVVSAATLSAAPHTVFQALVDGAAEMPQWYGAVRSVEYSAGAPPVAVGARRRIRLVGRAAFHETVLAVDTPSRFAYRIDRTTVPGLSAMAEEWTLLTTDTGTRVAWTVALDGPAVTRWGVRGLGPGVQAATRRALGRLDRRLGQAA